MILKDIWMDVKAVQERDPAARNALEVLLLYQGVHALIWHRVAHWFYEHHMFFIARLISQVARFFTLIEIHPGAQLGHGILIDHGCGVVIGETAVVGDNCTIYQGVTLGGVGTQNFILSDTTAGQLLKTWSIVTTGISLSTSSTTSSFVKSTFAITTPSTLR